MAFSLLLIGLAVVCSCNAQNGYTLPNPGYGYSAPDLRAEASFLSQQEDPVEALARNIVGGGVPGSDYPILASVPDTGFSCLDQEFPGYFADTADEAGCQVFHICQFDGRQDSFLCPNGTIFNQQYFVCDWWFNVDCAASVEFRSLNAEIGKEMTDAAASFRSDVVAPNQLYSVPQQRQSVPAPSQTYNGAQQRQAAVPSQSYSAPQQRQSAPTPSQTYGVPQERQEPVPAPSQSYGTPQQRRVTPAQTNNGSQQRQATPPSQVYGAPQQRQSAPAPSQTYGAPQERQEPEPAPSQSYGAPQQRQAPTPPSQLYNSPNRF